MNTKKIVLNALIAACYVVATLINPISYGFLQLRVSTILLPLSIYIPQIRAGLILGTFVSNINSPMGVLDMIFGTSVTFITVFFVVKIKNNLLKSIAYGVVSSVIVSAMLYFSFKVNFLYSVISVGASGIMLYYIGIGICCKISIILKKYW